MKVTHLLIECYITLLRTPINPKGLHEDIGEAITLGWRHGVITFDDFCRVCGFLRTLGYNPNKRGQFDGVPEDEIWQYQRAFLVFASRYARELNI